MKTFSRRFAPFLLMLLFSLPSIAQPAPAPIADQAAAAMKKIHEQHLTAQQAWDKAILNREMVLKILDSAELIDNGRGLSWPGRETDEFVALLLKQTPQDEKIPHPLPTNVAIRVAVSRMNHSDEKGTEALEDMLDEMPRQNADITTVDAILYCLSGHYQRIGQGKKAVETSLKIKEFTDDPTVLSNHLLSAARATADMGDKAGAQTLYNEVLACGYGWASGFVYMDMYRQKAAEGKLEEGRALLKTQFTGRNADNIHVLMYNTLAGSYLDTGEWDEAARWAQATIDQFKAVETPINGYGIENYAASAEAMLTRIEKYKNTPIFLEPAELTYTPGDTTVPVMLMVTVRAQKPVTVTFNSADPNFTCVSAPQPQAANNRSVPFYIKISPKAYGEDRTVELTFTAKEYPDTVLKLTVHLKKPVTAITQ